VPSSLTLSHTCCTSLIFPVFTCRCATSVNASTIICYRYRASSQSIFGLVVDRRERSQVMIDILKTFDLGIGLPLLPAIALAQASLHFNIRAVKDLESTYYLNKFLEKHTQDTAVGPVSEAQSLFFLRLINTMFNGVFSTTGCLEISTKALHSLTAMIRDHDKDEHIFDSMLDAIDSETEGHSGIAARTQERTRQRQMIYAASTQTSFLQQAHEANIKRNEVLDATRQATAASTDTLATMQTLLSDTRNLNRKTEEVQRMAADYGKLILAITFATYVSGCLSACAVGSNPVHHSYLPLGQNMIADMTLGDLHHGQMATDIQCGCPGTCHYCQRCPLLGQDKRHSHSSGEG
jgi:hypothetical protein